MGWNRWVATALLLALLAVCATILGVRFAVLARRVPIARAYRAPAAATLAGGGVLTDEHARADTAEPSNAAASEPQPGADEEEAAPASRGGTGAKAKPDPPPPDPGHRLDLNSATSLQPERLPGIGPVLGKRIVDYRKRYGPFRHIDDLDKVKGIGPSKLAKLRDYVYIRSIF